MIVLISNYYYIFTIGGEDYGMKDLNITFAFGFGRTQCVDIPILNDECLEEDLEFFNVSISSSFNCVKFNVDEISVSIRDDDGEFIIS